MSHESVEIVRRAIEVFISAGYDPRAISTDEFAEVFDPDIEFDVSHTNPETHVYRGRDGITEILEQWIQTWDDYEQEPLDLIDAGADRVVTVIRERGKLKGSDAWVEQTVGTVWTVRHRRIVKYEEHPGRAQALEAAGLSEQAQEASTADPAPQSRTLQPGPDSSAG
jgi:ketosteroid isomerase-like protein